MQKLLVAVIAFFILSCNSNDKKEKEDDKGKDKTTQVLNMSGYTADYSTSFESGDPKNAEKVLALWKMWDDGNLAPGKSNFADSVHFYLRDGSMIEGPLDSAFAGMVGYRSTLSNVKSTIHSVAALKSDKNDEWVLIWGNETSTDKNGKTESVELHEAWMFDKNGKVSTLYQYGAMMPAAKPK